MDLRGYIKLDDDTRNEKMRQVRAQVGDADVMMMVRCDAFS